MSTNDWSAVENNLRRDRNNWDRLSSILGQGGGVRLVEIITRQKEVGVKKWLL